MFHLRSRAWRGRDLCVALWQQLRGRQEGGAGQTPGCQKRFEGQSASWEVNASHPCPAQEGYHEAWVPDKFLSHKQDLRKFPRTSHVFSARTAGVRSGRGTFLLFLGKLTFMHPVFPLSWPAGSLRKACGVFVVPSLPHSPGSSAPLRVRHTLSGCPAPPLLPSVQSPGASNTNRPSASHARPAALVSEPLVLPFRFPPFFHPPPTSSPLPLARSCLPPPRVGGRSRKCAQSWRTQCFPLGGNAAFFTFHPEKYGSQ